MYNDAIKIAVEVRLVNLNNQSFPSNLVVFLVNQADRIDVMHHTSISFK